MDSAEVKEGFDEWCILEIMGHQRFAGRVTEQVVAGQAFIRIDVPEIDDKPPFSKLFGPSSIYGITPTTEAIAIGVARTLRKEPIQRYEIARHPLLSSSLDLKESKGYPVDDDDENDYSDDGQTEDYDDYEHWNE